MIRFKWMPPYQPDGSTTFPESKNRTGVYLIREHQTVVYVGFSGYNLYKTMYRHFQSWKDKTQQRVTYDGKNPDITVRLIYCSRVQADRLEKYLISRYDPRDNINRYQTVDYSPREVDRIAEVGQTFETTPDEWTPF